MKLASTIAALAFAAAVGGLGMAGTANAQPLQPQGNFCLHPYQGGGSDCGYVTRQQCEKDAQPMDGSCTLNGRVAYRSERYGHSGRYGYAMANGY